MIFIQPIIGKGSTFNECAVLIIVVSEKKNAHLNCIHVLCITKSVRVTSTNQNTCFTQSVLTKSS